jgi:hypothetical protein
MALSEVKIANMALIKLGAETIISLTQADTKARAINTIFEQVRDQELRAHPWAFAINRATLAVLSDGPAYGFDYRYTLPTDPKCLRVLEMLEERESGYAWRVEGRYLVTDSPESHIAYIGLSDDPSQWDDLFGEALSARIAAEVALKITNNRAIESDMWALYNEKIRAARLMNAIEEWDTAENPIEDEGSWISSR